MKQIMIVFLLCAGFCLAEDLEKVKKELAAIDAEVRPAILRGDFDTQLKYYADDAVILPDHHPMIKGKAGFIRQLEEDKKNGNVIHAIDGHITNLWTCGNKVFEQGVFYASMSNKFTDRPFALNISYFTIWERQKDGRLLIVYFMWNLDHAVR